MTLAREPRLQPELYFLEGYYTAPPPIDPAAWQTRLAAYLGHVEAIGDGDTPMFALRDYRCDYADRPGAPTRWSLNPLNPLNPLRRSPSRSGGRRSRWC